jgi:hypothetical protein
MTNLEQIAHLLSARNEIDASIAAMTGRPMTAGHLGEWIAAQIFDIELEESAAATAFDGHFRSGLHAGKTVNVKWYLKNESLIDLTADARLDFYLVLTGPHAPAASSRGTIRPWRIDHVFLFAAHQLLAEQHSRGAKIGTASSIPRRLWTEAEIYPATTNRAYALTLDQKNQLGLFSH